MGEKRAPRRRVAVAQIGVQQAAGKLQGAKVESITIDSEHVEYKEDPKNLPNDSMIPEKGYSSPLFYTIGKTPLTPGQKLKRRRSKVAKVARKLNRSH